MVRAQKENMLACLEFVSNELTLLTKLLRSGYLSCGDIQLIVDRALREVFVRSGGVGFCLFGYGNAYGNEVRSLVFIQAIERRHKAT